VGQTKGIGGLVTATAVLLAASVGLNVGQWSARSSPAFAQAARPAPIDEQVLAELRTIREALTGGQEVPDLVAKVDELVAKCSSDGERKMLDAIKDTLDSRSEMELQKRLLVTLVLLPQYMDPYSDGRESQLKSDLQTIRSQAELYKIQHLDTYPASGVGEDGSTMVAQLTQRTNVEGEVGSAADPEATLGPYILQFPINPFAEANGDKIEVGREQKADGDPGWFFNPDDGEFRANDAAHKDL
jgi:hypothetical protein